MHSNLFLKLSLVFQAMATVGICTEAWITQSLCGLVGEGQVMRWEIQGGSSESSASYHTDSTHPRMYTLSMAMCMSV